MIKITLEINEDDLSELRCARDMLLAMSVELASKQAAKNPNIPTHIHELELPIRVYNALMDYKLHNIRDLAKLDTGDLLKVPNIGRKAIRQIKDSLDGFCIPHNL